jgi:protease-4
MSHLTERFIAWPFMRSLVRMSVRIIAVWAVIFGCVIVTLALTGSWYNKINSVAPDPLANLVSLQGNVTSPNQLLALKIQGVIVGDDQSPEAITSVDATVSGYDIKRQLYAAANDSAIKGVLLEIDSPGGTIYGAKAIADGVKYYRDTTKQPVYAHIEGTGASGAYWAAASTNKIIADYGSDTGSIGVIMGPFEYYNNVLSETNGTNQIVTQNGIQSVEITAGRSKDLGNPYRQLTASEQSELQSQVNDVYAQFVSYISAQRHLSQDFIKNQLGAMTYDNQTAQTDKLIDASGSREDALDQLATASGISSGDYQVMGLSSSTSASSSLMAAFTHAATQPNVSSATGCALTRTPLAFSGDVTQLCKQ